jgi:hypothetical protein
MDVLVIAMGMHTAMCMHVHTATAIQVSNQPSSIAPYGSLIEGSSHGCAVPAGAS